MTKKEICNSNETIATYGFTNTYGIAIKHIDEVENHIYIQDEYGYYKKKIYFNTDRPYFIFKNTRIHLDECLRSNI